MKILVLNCGSSSIKYKLFDMTTKEVIAQGGIEKIGLKGSFLKLTLPNGEKKVLEKDIPEHTIGVEFILNTLISPEYGAIKSLDEINAVGHRMVHGGERFSESVLLNKEVLEAFAACNDLAPLHNPANLKGVNAVSAILPNIPQVGVFDTAFHQTLEPKSYIYPIPYKYYVEKVARLGFDILEIGVGPIADYSQTEIKELRKCADDNGIILTGGYGPTFNHNMGSSDPKIKAEALDWYKRTFDVMGELDMHWLGGALYSYWPVDFSTVNKPEDWKYSVEGVRELADAAKL